MNRACDTQPPPRMARPNALGACSALLAAFAALAFFSVRLKSPTMDEPIHSLAAFVHVFHRDWRIDPEQPPLWNYLLMLPHSRGTLRLNFDDPAWKAMLDDTNHGASFATRMLFQTPGNDGLRFIARSRLTMLAVGIALGVLIAWWSYRLCGPIGAIAATMLYCLDPSFLGHAPLVKNDVPIAFLMLALAMVLCSVGRVASWWNVLLLGLVIGAGMCVKFSGVLFVPMTLLALGVRALLPAPWPVLRREARGVWGKLAVGAGVSVVACAIAWGVIWASYGFRFDPTPAPGVLLPIEAQARSAVRDAILVRDGNREPPTQQIDHAPRPLLVRAVQWAERHQLAPQAWLYGLVFTYRASLIRRCYLLGQFSEVGWWYYFPLAMLFKTPLATLAAMVSAAWVCVRRKGAVAERWAHVCIFVPLVLYGIGALRCNLNLGHRHVLPMYPLAYLLTGLAAAKLAQQRPRVFRPVAIALAAGLAVETLAAWPNYIAFFNAPSRPWRLHLLSDSNLDWGQDLAELAAWRRQNPSGTLYLSYFGTVDPRVYGITDYVNLPCGFWLGPPQRWPDPRAPGVLAVSVNNIQGVNVPAELTDAYAALRGVRPRQVLGATIYLYDYPPRGP